MFGLGTPELALLIAILMGWSVFKTFKAAAGGQDMRKCLACGYEGNMKTWLGNYSGPQFIALILLLFYVIPGLIFIAWGWGKHKCPQCGTLGRSMIFTQKTYSPVDTGPEKKCPFCAENIKAEAIVCKHCNRDMPANPAKEAV